MCSYVLWFRGAYNLPMQGLHVMIRFIWARRIISTLQLLEFVKFGSGKFRMISSYIEFSCQIAQSSMPLSSGFKSTRKMAPSQWLPGRRSIANNRPSTSWTWWPRILDRCALSPKCKSTFWTPTIISRDSLATACLLHWTRTLTNSPFQTSSFR